MNSIIIQAKIDIINCINAEINQGVPPAALLMVIESVRSELEKTTNTIIEEERKQIQNEGQNHNEETEETNNGECVSD